MVEDKRNRRRGRTASKLGWTDVTDVLDKIRHIASTPDTRTRGYLKQREKRKLLVRERIESLVDKDSFKEIGSATGTPTWGPRNDLISFVPTNFVSGLARINDRKVAIAADDFTIRAGHADGALASKTVLFALMFGKSTKRQLHIERLSLEMKVPMVRLIDGSSGGGSVANYKELGYAYVPPLTGFDTIVRQLSVIPVAGAVLGPAVGLGAARVTATHFSVIAADVGTLFNAGPVVVAQASMEEGLTNEDLGGAALHTSNGTIDNYAADEKECFDQIRRFLSYLPSSVLELPPRGASVDPNIRDEYLRACIPTRRSRMYPIRPIIDRIVDAGSFFEIGRFWGQCVVVGFARLDGYPIGLVSHDCETTHGGALDAFGSQKLSKHIKLCDTFGLPVFQLTDMPGFAIGSVAERTATMRHGVECVVAYYRITVPMFSVIIRRCYGIAGAFLVDNVCPHQRVAWPSGEWGSLPLEGGIEAAYAHKLKEAGDKKDELLSKLKVEFDELRSPIRTAAAFGIEEIIDPAETRSMACEWVRHQYESTLPQRLRVQQWKVGMAKASL